MKPCASAVRFRPSEPHPGSSAAEQLVHIETAGGATPSPGTSESDHHHTLPHHCGVAVAQPAVTRQAQVRALPMVPFPGGQPAVFPRSALRACPFSLLSGVGSRRDELAFAHRKGGRGRCPPCPLTSLSGTPWGWRSRPSAATILSRIDRDAAGRARGWRDALRAAHQAIPWPGHDHRPSPMPPRGTRGAPSPQPSCRRSSAAERHVANVKAAGAAPAVGSIRVLGIGEPTGP